MSSTYGRISRLGVAAVVGCVGVTATAGPAAAAIPAQSIQPDLVFATSEIAQVMLSIAAVSFAVLAARLYGGEIGKAIYIVSGGVIVFSTWQLLYGATRLLNLNQPPATVGSTINLLITILLLAGFYMLYETISGTTTT